MISPARLLILGGLALAIVGMSYGLYFAVFVEHQTLDTIGGSLATSFVRAAERKLPESQAALDAYAETKYVYTRQVDVHSHWIGLGMLLIVLGAAFERVSFGDRVRFLLALALLGGSSIFPLGVILQTFDHGPAPRAIAIVGSGLIIAALSAVALGFARQRNA
jgi:hypothetical protein